LKQLITYIGLDVHKETMAVALAEAGKRNEVREYGKIANTPAAVKALVAKLARDGYELRFCYEAGPCGYGIQRRLTVLGHDCIVVAPSLIPRRPGDRIKTDRRDAINLAKLHRAGELTPVWVPDEAHEAIRDLVRARLAAVRTLRQARQQLSGFLLRHGHHYNRPAWTLMHRRWLTGLRFEHAVHHIVLEDCIAAVEAATARRDRLEAHIAAALPDWSLAMVVHALQALRGMALVAAATLVAELGDITRFANPRQLMAYLGLVPSEHSSGGTRRQGGITKAGNSAARRMLIEAAWSYRFPARISREQLLRQEGLGQADPRYRVEGTGTTLSEVSQVGAGGEATDRGHRRDRARAGRLCLGNRQTGAAHRRLILAEHEPKEVASHQHTSKAGQGWRHVTARRTLVSTTSRISSDAGR
jgi:transposase